MSDTAPALLTAPVAQAPAVVAPLLLDAAEAARLCGVCRTTWYAWHSAGKCPLPVRPGGQRVVRWRRFELDAWIAAGCPPRTRWQPMQGARHDR